MMPTPTAAAAPAVSEQAPVLFDPTGYEQPIALRAHEQAAVATLLHWTRSGKKGWPAGVKEALAPLLRPLYDLLDYMGSGNAVKRQYTVRTTVVCLLIRAMHRHHCTFWAFTPPIWLELLGQDYDAYVRQHGLTANARQQLIGVAYLLCSFTELQQLGKLSYPALATKLFGQAVFEANVAAVLTDLRTWGYSKQGNVLAVRAALAEALLRQRSPHVTHLSRATLEHLHDTADAKVTKRGLVLLSYVLVRRGQLTQPLGRDGREHLKERIDHRQATKGVPAPWLSWCERWYATSTLQPTSRVSTLYRLLQVGRWLGQAYPAVAEPGDWTLEVSAAFVAAVDRGRVGQWSSPTTSVARRMGEPFSARGKEGFLRCVRTFFWDCQEWGWIPRRFSPARALRTPSSVRAQIGPNPRVIADAVWAKLVWAGLNLTSDDLAGALDGREHRQRYPVTLIQAVAVVWLFTGLRRDEIRRLRVGCVRWQEPSGTVEPAQRTCLLDVPVNKTNTAFTKPVDATVGAAIAAWENVRPPQPSWPDRKTGERVQYLFCHRGRPLGLSYLNDVLIPLLCQKAGVPRDDARGPITSHRARATIASQLYNAKEPLSLVELQAWLGHTSPESTQHYTRISPTTLTQSYQNAGYFARNLRAVDVLIDQEAVQSGAAAQGEPWKYYDLGHGYCTYDFFDQCAHRMACAKCSFYRPKASGEAQLLEGKQHLQRMLQEIPLLDDERAAVEEGLEAMDQLLQRLAMVSTPGQKAPGQALNQTETGVVH